MDEDNSHIPMTLYLDEQDYQQINRVLKYHSTDSHYLNTILGIVKENNVSVTYKLNKDYSIGICVFCKGKMKPPYRLFINKLADINDVINIDGHKHQLAIAAKKGE